MQIPVLMESLPDHRYRARMGEPFCLTAEGGTTDEALENLRRLIEARKDQGARIVYLDMPAMDDPRERGAGWLDPEDPQTKAWGEAMAEYRKQREAELELL